MSHSCGPRFVIIGMISVCLLSLPDLALDGPQHGNIKHDSQAHVIHKALEQPISMEFANSPMQDAFAKLMEQTKLNFVLDRGSMQQIGIAPEQSLVTIKIEKAPLRIGLRRLLSQY